MYSSEVDESMIHGEVAPGFDEVEVEFARNFAERGELGAPWAIYHKGRKVVDLWGGYRDEKTLAPWQDDTLTQVFSIAVLLATKHGLREQGCLLPDQGEDWPPGQCTDPPDGGCVTRTTAV